MHLCFAGMLSKVPLKTMRKVRRKHLREAVAKHRKGHYHGHLECVFHDAGAVADSDSES